MWKIKYLVEFVLLALVFTLFTLLNLVIGMSDRLFYLGLFGLYVCIMMILMPRWNEMNWYS